MKWLTIILGTVLIGAVAASLTQKQFTNNATIQVEGDITYYIDGVVNAPSLDWGSMPPDSIWQANLTVTNNYNIPVTIYITTTGNLPGSLSWSLNNTIWQPSQTKGAIGEADWLELSIPADAVAGDYTWTTTITAEE